jgi:IS1 family transposase
MCYGKCMANVLPRDKQLTVLSALVEGASIRSVERMTGIHRDTVMRFGIKVGNGCADLLDDTMRDLPCERLELDEIWSFIGKKQRQVNEADDATMGDVWTWCALDPETKIVPSFMTGKRDAATAQAFINDLALRLRRRVQISTDGLRLYIAPIEAAFGSDGVDYAQIVKEYEGEPAGAGRYSPPRVVATAKTPIFGSPDADLVSTSLVERLNLTTRMQVRRFTRLTNAHSKKLENHGAAIALHFAHYNFVRRHQTLRCTPAMAAGVCRTTWTMGDLLDAAVGGVRP